LCIIKSTPQSIAAGVFTKNSFCAAPVQVSKEVIAKPITSLVVNSGCANAFAYLTIAVPAMKVCPMLGI
jgi:glutamate N-acetyltransferase/amino-acid N-acetyltransferase